MISDTSAQVQHSVAREWNEVLLEAIRNDFARPTVHARNLFHISGAMYDAWAAYDETASPYFLGNTHGNYHFEFNGIPSAFDKVSDQEEALSFAAYRILKHRFRFSPGAETVIPMFDSLMIEMGYDTLLTSTNYGSGSPASLGNYIAEQVIEFGLQDGSNEQFGYGNLHYLPVNSYNFNTLDPVYPGNPNIVDPNRWQPLQFGSFIDQSGNPIPTAVPEFLGAEWGQVIPFSLSEEDLTIYQRDGFDYWVYHDPGPPPFLDTTGVDESERYKWTFSLVATWSSHLDPKDGVMWDISPGALGNNPIFPATFEEYQEYYDLLNGGDPGTGWDVNPATGMPYEPQIVPRGDYARVLAEFWADGPDSETPPGHWFTILNYVNDHPQLEKRYNGQGLVLDDLEWDIKSYFLLGATMHDAAISAWGVKGWYDYVRPISALRYMTDLGQSSDPDLPNYNPAGIPLIDGYIELIEEGDSLVQVRDSVELIGSIKIKAWRGHNLDYIEDPDTSTAGVAWVPAGEWWSYQRPTFVTPPFAGYVSGHSTFSRAAAEVMTLLTGDEFFPGGMGEFHAPKNEFLVFEDGPSVDLTLQWATYRDASDQTSLSRIWGGIHPPADDIPGRIIGEQVGLEAFEKADQYFSGTAVSNETRSYTSNTSSADVYPNPVQRGRPLKIQLNGPATDLELTLYNILGQRVFTQHIRNRQIYLVDTSFLPTGMYLVRLQGSKIDLTKKIMILR
jgi:hypothetical protein